jgi:hypothetical protein
MDEHGGPDRALRARSSEQLLADPATSYWLRDALRSALLRDPADAALDALILHDVLVARFDQVLLDAKTASRSIGVRAVLS